ncbi:MAG TPA: phosphohydrolase, partial [Firmicutes bacterium]|nr:phosphohydrolase [Bacillota bacterium]
MERINKIIQDPCYQAYLAKIAALEETRAYCRHDFNHFVAAARIAYLAYLEEGGTGLG